jgi:Zinc finger C-x8-C-x5-C-x3-H type (and similar)
LLETKEIRAVIEIVVGDMSKGKEATDRELEQARDGDAEKKEIEEGLNLEVEKTENEQRVQGSDNEIKDIENREEGINGDNENVETEKREEMIIGDSDNLKTVSNSDSEKKSEEKEQGRNADSEKKVGVRKQRIDRVSEHEEIEEKGEVRYSDNEKEIGEKEEDRDGHSEDKGRVREKEIDCTNEKKGEKVLKERVKFPIPYPQRPFTPDCPTYLRTGHCSFGLVCYFNHPLRKSSKVSPNGDCKERETDDHQEKKVMVGRDKVIYAQPYPQREGKEDCLFYLKTGRCSYGANCCFNHPPRNLNQVCI